MQYRLRTLLIVTAVVPAAIGVAAIAARLARNRPASSIEIDWHFTSEPRDLDVEIVVDPKCDVLPESIGGGVYRIGVPDSHVVRLKSAKAITGKWRQDYIVTPGRPERRRVFTLDGSYSQGGKSPGDEGARHVFLFKLLD